MLALMSDFELIAEGLEFPEGPIAMPDGSIILVEIKRQTLTRVWNGRSEVIAHLGGGPNGAALGPDGAVYVCNNGGFAWHDMGGLTIPGHAAKDYTTGRIERVDLTTGKFERIYDKIGDHNLSGPNDIMAHPIVFFLKYPAAAGRSKAMTIVAPPDFGGGRSARQCAID